MRHWSVSRADGHNVCGVDVSRQGARAQRRPGFSVRLARAAPQQYDGNRLEEDLPVQRWRPMVDVFEVQFHPAPEAEPAAALERPQTREARLHAQPAALPGLVFFHLLGQRRARSYEGHVALQDVDELRKLIQA